MAPDARNPNRGASPMQAGETPTSADDGNERTTISPAPEREPYPDAKSRRAAVTPEARTAGRRTEVYREKSEKAEKPDVVGAPERTVIAPLPPRQVDVEPVPAASPNSSRLAAEAEVRRRRRADDDARFRDDRAGRDAQRRSAQASRDERVAREERSRDARNRAESRERRDPRETEREGVAEPPRSAAKETTAPAGAGLREGRAGDRNAGRREPDQSLVHQPTSVERAGKDTPWTRLVVAVKDVSDALVVSAKDSWTTLRTQGVKPFMARMKPGAQLVWARTRALALRLRAVAVIKAVELGLVKPKRVGQYEQHGDDRLDEQRVEAWRKFHKGKTSSSYLQDDE